MISFKIPGIDLLTPYIQGADAALKVINADGGVDGHPIKMVTCNSMLEPAASTTCAHTTIAAHPLTMMGCELAWSVSGLPIYTAANIPSLNCLNNEQDFHSQWNFGFAPGEAGDNAATVAYICTLSDVHTVVTMITDVPSSLAVQSEVTTPGLKACGKTPVAIPVSPTVVDLTPYVEKALQSHPQFIIGNIQTAQVPQMYTLFKQNGIPASHISSADVAFTAQILASAPQMKGGLSIAEFNPWTDTSDPTVAEYVKAMQGASVDYRDPSVEQGYSLMEWFYDSAKAVGFSNLTGPALANYWRMANNVPMPLSRDWTNPGPSSAPAVKQPYARVLQWNGTTFVPVSGGDDGWFNGLK
jgi:ABC-type branched-subunit amino acid transport system substrate-binding protein